MGVKMNQILKRTKQVFRAIGIGEIVITTIMLVMILAVILVQVFMRKVFNQPNAWAEEIAIYLFIWITMIGSSIAMKMQRHITIRTFISALSKIPQFIIRIAVQVIMVWVSIFILIQIPKILRVEFMSNTVALPINIPRAWFFSIPLLYSMISLSVILLYYIISTVNEFLGGTALTSILDPEMLEMEDEMEEIVL